MSNSPFDGFESESAGGPPVIETPFDVVVVGGGLSGLAAMLHLLDLPNRSLKILLVEARGRVGGRTQTELCPQVLSPEEELKAAQRPIGKRGSEYVDIGGQWLGPGQDAMLELVKQLGLELEEQAYPPTLENNRLVEFAHYELPPLPEIAAKEVATFKEYLEECLAAMNPDEPWMFPSAVDLDKKSVQQVLRRMMTTKEARSEIEMFTQTVMACSPDKCSFLYFLYMVKCGGGLESLGDGAMGAQKWKVKGGAQQVSDLLLEKILTHKKFKASGSHVLLRHAVTAIDQSEADTTSLSSVTIAPVDPLQNGGRPLKDTMEPRCRRVIVAVAPSVVMTHISFYPPLPKGKELLWSTMFMGSIVKVILVYREAFWTKRVGAKAAGTKNLHDLGLIHNIFVSNVAGLPALVGLISGPYATKYGTLSPEARRKSVLTQLTEVYGPEASTPVSFVEKDWQEEVYSGGAFACVFPPTANSLFANHSKTLREPTGRIHWASTELAIRYSAYMEGAVLSGRRAADEVAEALPIKANL